MSTDHGCPVLSGERIKTNQPTNQPTNHGQKMTTPRSKFQVGDRVAVRKYSNRAPVVGVVEATSGKMPLMRRRTLRAATGSRIVQIVAPGVSVRAPDSMVAFDAHDDMVTRIKRAPRSRFQCGDLVTVQHPRTRQPVDGVITETSGSIMLERRVTITKGAKQRQGLRMMTEPGARIRLADGSHLHQHDDQIARRKA